MTSRRGRETGRELQYQRKVVLRGIQHPVPDLNKLSRAFIGLATARARTVTDTSNDTTNNSVEVATTQTKDDLAGDISGDSDASTLKESS